MNLEEIDYLQKVQRYMMTMRPVFQPHALFSDETANYVEPMEPMPGETVTIRFRAGLNNVDSVFLISGSRKLLMDYEKTEGRFDYYTVKVEMTEEIFRYYFEVCAGKISCFYNKRGVSRDLQEYYSFAIAPGISDAGLGQRALSCIRFIRIVFTMEIRPTMWKTGNIITSGTVPPGYGTGTNIRNLWESGNFTEAISRAFWTRWTTWRIWAWR